jgi:nucleoside-triphosphatase
MIKCVLLTGLPRTGKTTLLKKIIENLNSCGGFYTEQIIQNNKRIGFKIKTLDGKEGILAKKDLESKYRLGKYGINLEDLENIGVKAIERAIREKEVVVIDEIGKMEFFSEKFKRVVSEALDSDRIVIGVIHRNLLDTLKFRSDVEILEVNLNNHQEILKRCRSLLQSLSIQKIEKT